MGSHPEYIRAQSETLARMFQASGYEVLTDGPLDLWLVAIRHVLAGEKVEDAADAFFKAVIGQ